MSRHAVPVGLYLLACHRLNCGTLCRQSVLLGLAAKFHVASRDADSPQHAMQVEQEEGASGFIGWRRTASLWMSHRLSWRWNMQPDIRCSYSANPPFPSFAAAVENLGLPAKQVLMTGDDIEADVAGAQAAGSKGALVRTGKFSSSKIKGSVRPDVVFDNIADLPQWWNGNCT
jgi:hypothetical protein